MAEMRSMRGAFFVVANKSIGWCVLKTGKRRVHNRGAVWGEKQP